MNKSVIVCLCYGSRSYHQFIVAGYAQRVLAKLANALDTAIVVENEEATITLNHKNVYAAYDVLDQMNLKDSIGWLELVAINALVRSAA